MLSRLVTRSVLNTNTSRLSKPLILASSQLRQQHTQSKQHEQADKSRAAYCWLAIGAMTGIYVYVQHLAPAHADTHASGYHKVNYDEVRRDIASILDKDGYDDGSLGPLFVRLAWHSSGSFSATDGNGGSNGALIRYGPQKFWGGNAGIGVAIDALEPIKKKHPNISYGDLYTLCGVVAIEEMGGPVIPWRPGRIDYEEGTEFATKGPQQDNRLPDAAKGKEHLRDVFYRMGFGDKDIVALSGAHCLGRCHRDRSGFDGPWSRSPTTFSNQYFILLRDEKWTPRKWDGPKQYANNESGGDLMMLPSDVALLDDADMKKWVMKYAEDEDLYFEDFAAAFSKLLELGVSFHASESKAWYHKLFG